jgi:hypothetical protein
MNEKKHPFHMTIKYLQELGKHTVNVYSVVSLILAFVAILLLRLSTAVNAAIVTSAAFLSILIAGFYVWKEAIHEYPKTADLSIKYKSCIFGASSSRGGIPLSPMRFRIKLDAINHGQEPAVLTEIKVVKFNMNNKLLADHPSTTEAILLNDPHGSNQINYPLMIDGLERLPNIEYRISVNLVREMEPLEFARSLGEFQNYEIELEYSFEDMARTINSRRILIQDSFEKYRQQRVKEWSNSEHLYGLALAALRALGTID